MRYRFALNSLRYGGLITTLQGFLAVIALGQPFLHAKELRPFSIKDSIEISYFSDPALWTTNHDPSSMVIPSPDGRWLSLVTQRGHLSSNDIESTVWLFRRQALLDFTSKKSILRPVPRALARFRAMSDTPVISDVRWLGDSTGVAFLAKRGGGTSHLYVANLTSQKVVCITKDDEYVSAYDIRGDTIAYTTFDQPRSARPAGDMVDVTGRSIWSLLWRDRPLAEQDEAWLLRVPNTLHILRKGRELNVIFTMDGRPLKLFFPVLAISPDRRSLVTIAPVHTLPAAWSAYQPRFGYENLQLVRENKSALDETNPWRASLFVNIKLQTGVATPLIDAPAGRSLFQVIAPTQVIWSPDSREVLVSDTFLPLANEPDPVKVLRAASPAIAIINLRSREVQPIAFLEQPAQGTHASRHVGDITWDTRKREVVLRYATSPDNVPLAFRTVYHQCTPGWVKEEGIDAPTPDVDLTVVQDLNRSPVFAARNSSSGEAVVIWDPNPQLASVSLGLASLYQWNDGAGNLHKGILVLPADYKIGTRYPLVIQTHGYEANKFFADGIYTTGSGGRALVGKEIIVLQMDMSVIHMNTPQDGPAQIDAFRSAIRQLANQGLVDPERVGVIGFSFTVFHTLYALTHAPDLFVAASITDGNDLSYWLYLTWTDIPYAQKWAEVTNGDAKPFGKEGLLKWAESAPGFNLDQVRAPLLISCLEKGSLVASWDIYGGLRTLDKPVELLWLKKENAPHVLVQPRQRYLSQQSAVDWFDFWLNGREDSDARKDQQYGHWRELRKLAVEQHGRTIRPLN